MLPCSASILSMHKGLDCLSEEYKAFRLRETIRQANNRRGFSFATSEFTLHGKRTKRKLLYAYGASLIRLSFATRADTVIGLSKLPVT